jgi:hypothetical protein
VGGATLGVSSGLLIGHDASAGHTITNGACHRAQLICRTNYTARSSVPDTPGVDLYIRNIYEWAPGSYEYNIMDFPAAVASESWTNRAGPQDIDVIPRPEDGWNYLNTEVDPEGNINGPPVGATYLCNQYADPPCSVDERSIDIQWADLYFDFPVMNGRTIEERQKLAAHEIGHSLGLYHHPDQDSLMHPAHQETTPFAPTEIEEGLNQDCRRSYIPPQSQFELGVRCIYGWYETPTPPPGGGGGGGAGSPGCSAADRFWGKCTAGG